MVHGSHFIFKYSFCQSLSPNGFCPIVLPRTASGSHGARYPTRTVSSDDTPSPNLHTSWVGESTNTTPHWGKQPSEQLGISNSRPISKDRHKHMHTEIHKWNPSLLGIHTSANGLCRSLWCQAGASPPCDGLGWGLSIGWWFHPAGCCPRMLPHSVPAGEWFSAANHHVGSYHTPAEMETKGCHSGRFRKVKCNSAHPLFPWPWFPKYIKK